MVRKKEEVLRRTREEGEEEDGKWKERRAREKRRRQKQKRLEEDGSLDINPGVVTRTQIT